MHRAFTCSPQQTNLQLTSAFLMLRSAGSHCMSRCVKDAPHSCYTTIPHAFRVNTKLQLTSAFLMLRSASSQAMACRMEGGSRGTSVPPFPAGTDRVSTSDRLSARARLRIPGPWTADAKSRRYLYEP